MIRKIEAQTVLQKSRLPESTYCLNPYVGCTHRCSYCYARFMRRFTGHSEPWGSFVDVKINASDVLERQLERLRVKGSVLMGSVCDAYQPIEKRYGLSRRCMRLLVDYKMPFSVLTKSKLILRDLDILVDAGDAATVGVSISILDESVRRRFEPGASSIQDRLDTLEELHKNGVRTYVFIGPILPIVSDPAAIVKAAGLFVDEVWGEALNMRCGNREDLALAYAACKLPDKWYELARSEKFWSEMASRLGQACLTANRTLVGFYKH